ncbi:MAG: hypothetical protein WB808_02010 [Candidatus Dormiibacterota bacterium]
MDFRRAACTALLAPLALAGGIFVSTLGSTSVLAASRSSVAAKTPASSSTHHEHESVECTPGKVAEKHGQCAVVFVDKSNAENSVGQKVCFSVSNDAGSVQTGTGNCAYINKNDKALGTFTTSGSYCGRATITAVEPNEGDEQAHHTTITIVCPTKATTTSVTVPAAPPSSPMGWLLGAMGVGIALLTGYAVWTRRWFAARRHGARQSA